MAVTLSLVRTKRFFVWSSPAVAGLQQNSESPRRGSSHQSPRQRPSEQQPEALPCPNAHPTASTRLRWSGGICIDPEPGVKRDSQKPSRSSSCCTWRGPISNLALHLETECDFVLCSYVGVCPTHTTSKKSPTCIACRSRCPFSMAPASLHRDSLDTHMAQCPHRLIACDGCGSQIFAAFDWVHKRECKGCLVSCEFCHQPMPQGVLNVHELYKCDRAPEVQCPRCLTFVPRGELLTRHALGACPGEHICCPLPCSRSKDRRCFEWMRREEAAQHLLDADFETQHEEQRQLQETYRATQLGEEEVEGIDGDAAARVFADY